MGLWKYIFGGLIVVAALLAASCADDMYNNAPDEPLKLSVDTIRVGKKGQVATIGVTARDAAWTMEGSRSWCETSPGSGEKGLTRVTVTFTSNDPDETEGAVPRKTIFTFRSGDNEKIVVVEQLIVDIEPEQNPDAGINSLIHEQLEKWYYNGEPGDVRPDLNQNYENFYFNYLSHLRNNEDFEGKMWARGNERYIYSYIERNPVGTHAMNRKNNPRLNYGMEFDLVEYNGRLVARILYVEPRSPAAAAGLKRGDWFWKVNNTQLVNASTPNDEFRYQYQRYIDSLVHPVAGVSLKLGMLSFRAAQETLYDEKREVTITPRAHQNNPVIATQMFSRERLPAGSGLRNYVGYMMLNSFDSAYETEITDAFRNEFKNGIEGEQLDSFILDLRYNKSGSVEMAELVGNLLAGNTTGVIEGRDGDEDEEYVVAGRKFADYTFNGTASPPRTSAVFAAHEHGIKPGTVYVLTSRNTAGAAELLINALRGLEQSVVKLVMIGEVTQGLAAGMVKRTIPDPTDPGWEYSAWMLAFTTKNAAGQGNYTSGLVPNGGEVSEWTRGENMKWSTEWKWKGEIGSTEDPLIRRAVEIIEGRQSTPTGSVVISTSKRSREGLPREFCFPTDMTIKVE